MTRLIHVGLAALAAVEMVRAIHQPWLRVAISDERLVFGWAIVLPIASAGVSLLAIWRGWARGRSERAAIADLATLALAFALVFLISLEETPLPIAGAATLLVLSLAFRLAGLALASSDMRLPEIAIPGSRSPAAFVAMNAALILLLFLWPLPETCVLGCSMRARWMPFGLALATALTLALSWRCTPMYRRHALLWLTVPPAFALTAWSGEPQSLVGVPVVALAAGIALQGMLALHATADLRRDRGIGALLGLTVLAASLTLMPWVRTVQPTQSDEPHYLLTMASLVEDHDFDLKNQYDRADYADYYPTPLDARHVIDVGTTEMPIHDLGLPIIGAIPFALGRRTGVLILMCLVGACFAWRGYALLRVLLFRPHTALLATGAVSLLHPLFTYATQIFPDSIGALVTLVAAEQLARPVTAKRLAVASALLGVLPWLSARHWFIAIGMGLVVAGLAFLPLFRGRPRSAVPLVLAAALPFAAIVGAYAALDAALYGVPVPNAGYFVIRDQQQVLAFTPWIGAAGLLLDRTFGLLSHAPIYLLAFLGAGALWRRWGVTRSRGATPSPAILALFLGWLLYFVYVADIFYWWADGAPPSRYLLASIAFLLVAAAAGLDMLRSRIGVALAWSALACSAAVTLLYAVAPNIRYDLAVDMRPTGGPGFLWVTVTKVLRADPGIVFPSMVRAALEDHLLAAAWMLALLGLVVIGFRAARTPDAAGVAA
jgi:hypothetical protein